MVALKKEAQAREYVCVCVRACLHAHVISAADSPGVWMAPEETCLKKLSMVPANAHFVTQTGRER